MSDLSPIEKIVVAGVAKVLSLSDSRSQHINPIVVYLIVKNRTFLNSKLPIVTDSEIRAMPWYSNKFVEKQGINNRSWFKHNSDEIVSTFAGYILADSTKTLRALNLTITRPISTVSDSFNNLKISSYIIKDPAYIKSVINSKLGPIPTVVKSAVLPSSITFASAGNNNQQPTTSSVLTSPPSSAPVKQQAVNNKANVIAKDTTKKPDSVSLAAQVLSQSMSNATSNTSQKNQHQTSVNVKESSTALTSQLNTTGSTSHDLKNKEHTMNGYVYTITDSLGYECRLNSVTVHTPWVRDICAIDQFYQFRRYEEDFLQTYDSLHKEKFRSAVQICIYDTIDMDLSNGPHFPFNSPNFTMLQSHYENAIKSVRSDINIEKDSKTLKTILDGFVKGVPSFLRPKQTNQIIKGFLDNLYSIFVSPEGSIELDFCFTPLKIPAAVVSKYNSLAASHHTLDNLLQMIVSFLSYYYVCGLHLDSLSSYHLSYEGYISMGHECYASPLNVKKGHTYSSFLVVDSFFGSVPVPTNHRTLLINPPWTESMLKSAALSIAELKPSEVFFVCPQWKDAEFNLILRSMTDEYDVNWSPQRHEFLSNSDAYTIFLNCHVVYMIKKSGSTKLPVTTTPTTSSIDDVVSPSVTPDNTKAQPKSDDQSTFVEQPVSPVNPANPISDSVDSSTTNVDPEDASAQSSVIIGPVTTSDRDSANQIGDLAATSNTTINKVDQPNEDSDSDDDDNDDDCDDDDSTSEESDDGDADDVTSKEVVSPNPAIDVDTSTVPQNTVGTDSSELRTVSDLKLDPSALTSPTNDTDDSTNTTDSFAIPVGEFLDVCIPLIDPLRLSHERQFIAYAMYVHLLTNGGSTNPVDVIHNLTRSNRSNIPRNQIARVVYNVYLELSLLYPSVNPSMCIKKNDLSEVLNTIQTDPEIASSFGLELNSQSKLVFHIGAAIVADYFPMLIDLSPASLYVAIRSYGDNSDSKRSLHEQEKFDFLKLIVVQVYLDTPGYEKINGIKPTFTAYYDVLESIAYSTMASYGIEFSDSQDFSYHCDYTSTLTKEDDIAIRFGSYYVKIHKLSLIKGSIPIPKLDLSTLLGLRYYLSSSTGSQSIEKCSKSFCDDHLEAFVQMNNVANWLRSNTSHVLNDMYNHASFSGETGSIAFASALTKVTFTPTSDIFITDEHGYIFSVKSYLNKRVKIHTPSGEPLTKKDICVKIADSVHLPPANRNLSSNSQSIGVVSVCRTSMLAAFNFYQIKPSTQIGDLLDKVNRFNTYFKHTPHRLGIDPHYLSRAILNNILYRIKDKLPTANGSFDARRLSCTTPTSIGPVTYYSCHLCGSYSNTDFGRRVCGVYDSLCYARNPSDSANLLCKINLCRIAFDEEHDDSSPSSYYPRYSQGVFKYPKLKSISLINKSRKHPTHDSINRLLSNCVVVHGDLDITPHLKNQFLN